MIKGFRDFILRGNVVDLAVAVIIGAAFGAVVTAFTNNIMMQFVAAIYKKPDFSKVAFDLNGTHHLAKLRRESPAGPRLQEPRHLHG